MADRKQYFNSVLFSTFFVILFALGSNGATSKVKELNEDNWREILTGEWMVEFYAPWCPACNALSGPWQQLADRNSQNNVNTGAIDVTLSPGLSGRFVVTALPTIFHVKDGQFRQYTGARDVDSMSEFVTKQRWRQKEPVSKWKAPDSVQMSLVANFFKFSQALRGVHTMLMETYGLPTWGSYLIFAVVTIFTGALLGLLLVCVIDGVFPVKRPASAAPGAGVRHSDSGKMPPIPNDDLVDEREGDAPARGGDGGEDAPGQGDGEDTSDAEKYSGSDTQSEGEAERRGESERDAPEADGNSAAAAVRKRRPRRE